MITVVSIIIVMNISNSHRLDGEELADLEADLQDAVEKNGLVIQSWDWETE